MSASAKKVAWILGSGFSRPLGGPLLDGLISRQLVGDLRHWPDFTEDPTVEGHDKVKCAEAVEAIYRLGCEQKHATFWSNPEQFIERLDWASRTTTNLWAFRIRQLVPDTRLAVRQLDPLNALDPLQGMPRGVDLSQLFADNVKLLRREATRLVAAACSYFTRDVGHIAKQELWMPYLRWANQLQRDDVILTFNYDNVLDLMDPHLTQTKLRWMVPKNTRGELGEFGNSKGPRVFHLHGHVGWQRDAKGLIGRVEPAAHLHPEKAVMGMPGPSKKELSDSHLTQVWSRAFAELAEADRVVFVGYRFPESDGLARHSILEALRSNQKARVYIVLGPGNGKGSKDIARVAAMINWTRTNADDAEVERMWAEDFFEAFERDRL